MTAIGALIGLVLAIVLIIRKVPVAYSLMAGALAGGLLGGMGLEECISAMIKGVQGINPAILRVLSAGVLSGVLVVTGAAESISYTIIRRLGRKNMYLALALSAMLLTAVGVFIDVAVITVSPIAISMCRRYGESPMRLLLVMVGGGKAGNVISPNPNTIVSAENFNAPLSEVMAANIVAAIVGLVITVWVVDKIYARLHKAESGKAATDEAAATRTDGLPSFGLSLVGPIVAIGLLALRPVCGVVIDPLVALPVGGIVGLLAMRRHTQFLESMQYGISKMIPVAVLLIGTGTIAGIIQASTIKDLLIDLLTRSQASETLLAPVAGALMSAATASTTAGASLASSSFSATILAAGIPAVWGAAMVNSSATVLDHLPHGSFFHATGGAMELTFRQSMALIPYETAIGLALATVTVCSYELMTFIL